MDNHKDDIDYQEILHSFVAEFFEKVTKQPNHPGMRDYFISRLQAEGIEPMEIASVANTLQYLFEQFYEWDGTRKEPEFGEARKEPAPEPAKVAPKAKTGDPAKGEAARLAAAEGIEPFALLPGAFHDEIMALPDAEHKVITELAYHRNKRTGLANPGLQRLSDRTHFSARTVSTALDALQDRKLIRYHGGGYKGTNTQWHVFGPGLDGECKECKTRKRTGGRPKLEKASK